MTADVVDLAEYRRARDRRARLIHVSHDGWRSLHLAPETFEPRHLLHWISRPTSAVDHPELWLVVDGPWRRDARRARIRAAARRRRRRRGW